MGEIVEHGKNTKQQHNRMLLQKKKTPTNVIMLFWVVRVQLAYLRQGCDNPPVLGSQGSWLGPVWDAACGDSAKLE